MNPLVELQEIEIPPAKAEWMDKDVSPDVWAHGTSELRLAVQLRARGELFRHGVRDATRVFTLIAVDGVVFQLGREGLQALRARGPLPLVGDLLPGGYLGGVQFFVALVISLAFVGAYRRGDAWRSGARWLYGVAIATGLALWAPLWSAGPALVIPQYLFTLGAVLLLLSSGRIPLRHAVSWWRRRGGWIPSAIIVGDLGAIHNAIRSAVFKHPDGYRVDEVVEIDGPATDPRGVGAELARTLLATRASAVFMTGNLSDDQFRQIVEVAQSYQCELNSMSKSLDIAGAMAIPRVCCGVNITALTRPGLKAHEMILKRVFDGGSALVGLILISPLLAMIAIGVRLSSPGPVLFRQVRVGRGGRHFKILKFRSMIRDAEARRGSLQAESLYPDARLFKMENDPRVTPMGKFLRRTSLDELPQLFNVLRGQMALVGPRPPTPDEVELYESRHLCRFDVRPGITGPWQSGGRNLIRDFEQVVLMEKHYIQNWSIISDLKILLKTVPVVLRGVGAG